MGTRKTKQAGEPLLNAKQAAKLLGISERTLHTLVKSGLVPRVRISQRRFGYQPEDLREYTTKHRSKTNPNDFDSNSNLRTQFCRILDRAGIKPWPRIFQNLRASRETELLEKFPLQVVTAWMGNSPKIALKHYLMTHDEHYEKAAEWSTKVVQKAVRQPSETNCIVWQQKNTNAKKAPDLQGLESPCENLHHKGLERSRRSSEETLRHFSECLCRDNP